MTDKPSVESADRASINRQKLAELFPGVIADGAVNWELLRSYLGEECFNDEAYELTWIGKRASLAEALRPTDKTLRPCEAESRDWDHTANLYLEGDNLAILKLLQTGYRGRVKMIYIDPPYNTGNEFIYRDDFRAKHGGHGFNEEGQAILKPVLSGHHHSDWCSMLYPRLILARDLLRDDGVVFISIDENEVSALQQLCNEVFGRENYAATFIWTKTATPHSRSGKCRKTVEYVLAYEKRWSPQKYFGSLLDNGDAPLLNTGNPVHRLTFPAGSVRFGFIEMGIIEAGAKKKLTLEDRIQVENGVNCHPFSMTGGFKWSQKTLDREVASGTYFLVKTEKFLIRFQRVGNEDSYKAPTNFMNIELKASSGVGTNENALKELRSLGLSECFDYPKPVSLIEALCSMVCKFDREAIILDLFSGSATTAEAVMRLNVADLAEGRAMGRRKFILAQLPEVCPPDSRASAAGYRNICEIGKERIRRAGDRILRDCTSIRGERKLDIGFRVFKLDSVSVNDAKRTPVDIQQSSQKDFKGIHKV